MYDTTNKTLSISTTARTKGYQKRHQQGFSVIELMVVLAVAGMLIVGALIAGTTVMNGVKANRYVNEISTIATQSRAWKGVKTDYSGLGNLKSTDCASATPATKGICMLVAMGRLPNAINTENGTYVLAVGDPTSEFVITSNGMTDKICKDVAEQIKGQTVDGAGATCSLTKPAILTAIFK